MNTLHGPDFIKTTKKEHTVQSMSREVYPVNLCHRCGVCYQTKHSSHDHYASVHLTLGISSSASWNTFTISTRSRYKSIYSTFYIVSRILYAIIWIKTVDILSRKRESILKKLYVLHVWVQNLYNHSIAFSQKVLLHLIY